MADVFAYGTLCHAPLRAAVLGREVAGAPARLAGHAVRWAEGEAFALIRPEAGAVAEGIVLRGLSADDVARLDWYEGGFARSRAALSLMDGAGTAEVYLPDPGRWTAGAPWSLADWIARHGAVVVATAPDVMRQMGLRPAAAVWQRYPQMLVRGAARLRAAVPRPATLGFRPAADDVALLDWQEPYADFFAVESVTLRHRRFDGAMGDPIRRAVFVSADAVTVLPYDPARDAVMVIEQFRAAPYVRGDANPWLIEAIAGRIDAFETAEDAARREALEEAGIALGALHPVAEYYPSPGAKTEYLWSYVGIADLPAAAAGLGGVEGEGEDIRAHVLPFDAFMALVDGGEAVNGPLVLTALWLARHRDRLRAG
ncbi:MAG: NUDIX domain-containing protein [Gemmobacter sp.]